MICAVSFFWRVLFHPDGPGTGNNLLLAFRKSIHPKRLWIWLLLVLIMGARADERVPIPELARWESQMIQYGRTHANNLMQADSVGPTYYDAQRVFFQIGDYTGDDSWYPAARQAEYLYRDGYLLPNNYGAAGWMIFPHGMGMNYLREGDQASREAVINLSTRAAYASDGTPLAWTASPLMMREVAYNIMSMIWAERLGYVRRERMDSLVDQALSHLDQTFLSQTFRMDRDYAHEGCFTGQTYVKPFMAGLIFEALILYDQTYGDPRILPAIRASAEYLWHRAWVPNATGRYGAFWYVNCADSPGDAFPERAGAADLNLLIAPAYAWLYKQTGDVRYRDWGDQVFAGGVVGAWLGGSKHFNQNYRWSFDYVGYRTGEISPFSPSPMGAPARLLLGVNLVHPDRPRHATVRFALDVPMGVRLQIYGREQLVRTLFNGALPPGEHDVVWDGTNDTGERVASGVYTAFLKAGEQRLFRKIVVVR